MWAFQNFRNTLTYQCLFPKDTLRQSAEHPDKPTYILHLWGVWGYCLSARPQCKHVWLVMRRIECVLSLSERPGPSHHIILCYLYFVICIILHYRISCYMSLWYHSIYIILYYIILFYIILYYGISYYTILYYIVLYYIVLYFVFYRIELNLISIVI